jgi:hypothetical protein
MSRGKTPLTDQILRVATQHFWSNIAGRDGSDGVRAFDAQYSMDGAFEELFGHIWDYEDVPEFRNAKLYRKLHKELWPEERLPKAHPMSNEFAQKVIGWVHEELVWRLIASIPEYRDVMKSREELVKEYKTHPSRRNLRRLRSAS